MFFVEAFSSGHQEGEWIHFFIVFLPVLSKHSISWLLVRAHCPYLSRKHRDAGWHPVRLQETSGVELKGWSRMS